MSENRYLEINLRKFSHMIIILSALTYFLSIKVLSVQDTIRDQQSNILNVSNKARKFLVEEFAGQQMTRQKHIEETPEDDSVNSSEERDF